MESSYKEALCAHKKDNRITKVAAGSDLSSREGGVEWLHRGDASGCGRGLRRYDDISHPVQSGEHSRVDREDSKGSDTGP